MKSTSAETNALTFSVVGVGASAGGLEAYRQFLAALPADTGMAFVLIQHLAPDRESALAHILSRETPMPVAEVTDQLKIEPNRIYLNPPDWNVEIEAGCFRLLPRQPALVQHPIDQFFHSLAEAQGHQAVAVVLSGAASDGTIGLEAIKAAGGITFAQDESAQQSGMPDSARASGSVDFVLPPSAIAREIARIASHPHFAPPKSDDGINNDGLQAILSCLQRATGVNFQEYKANTLLRRITRRMAMHKWDSLNEYAEALHGDLAEVQVLYEDILINVTSFFRDPETFVAVKKILQPMLEGRTRHEPLRVWTVGCSTGEEAYSLAMTLCELSQDFVPAQIFATDLNEKSVQRARTGIYSRTRVENVSPERLRRFFLEVNGGFQVCPAIREMCIFSRHNLMSDPPFSRMDLVTCRNLLIYLAPSLQQKIIPLFHYALKPGGCLLLGCSENVGRFRDLFEELDNSHRIFARKPGASRLPTGTFPGRTGISLIAQPSQALAPTADAGADQEVEKMLLAYAPAAVVVDARGEILEFRGDTKAFLSPARGKASLDLMRMARPQLAGPLRTLLHRAKRDQCPAQQQAVQLEHQWVDLEVVPIKGHTSLLVLFKEAIPQPAQSPSNRPDHDEVVVRLEHELASGREYLQTVTEQHEAAMEELQSSNEEAQSANEELQSMNEELQTSKEEIQSSNEELATVNDELQNRNLELGRLNSDLINLIGNIHVAIVIVGRDQHIRRISPSAEKLLNIQPSDIGRPMSDFRTLAALEPDTLLSGVLRAAGPQERELQCADGRWYSLSVHPYLTLDNRIDGAVLSLVDIDAVRRSREFAENIVATVREPLLVLDSELRVLMTSEAFYKQFGGSPSHIEGRAFFSLSNGRWDIPALRRILLDSPGLESGVKDVVLDYDFPDLGARSLVVNTRRFAGPDTLAEYILLSLEDISERRLLEMELARQAAEVAAADLAKSHFIAVLSHELRSPLAAVCGWVQILCKPNVSPEDLRTGLEVIDRNSKKQARLIEDILDTERIATGKVRLELSPVDLSSLLGEDLDAIAPAAAQKEIRLHLDIPEGPAQVSADPVRLHQVLANLLGNALKFTPRGGEVRVQLQCLGAWARISIRDTGQGISPDAMAHLFGRFRQADPAVSRFQGGLGLGLSIAKQLIELHGGTIEVESAGPGQGATFTVSLPLLAKATARPAAVAEPIESPPVTLGGLLILVVDDEPDAREPVRRLLEDAGAKTLAVGSVSEALAAFRQRQPDLVVSDIGMPEQDGYDLIKALRALPAEQGKVPAIALTAYATPEDRERSTSAGFQDHLAKPVDGLTLITRVAELVVNSRGNQ